ncbi:MAG: hypothetical protein DMF03_00835 [Verrucomicrobia bacterium]|nr:MAG: hypothetical protein DMF03_00835 [Verrucomicrobiota bacterium]
MKVHWIIFGVASLLAIGLLQAGPPFVTDDPEPPPPGGWEVNVPFTFERTPGKTEMDAPLFDFNYGLPDVQLKLEFPIEVAHDDAKGMAAGAGDLLLGVKWLSLIMSRRTFKSGLTRSCCCPRAIARVALAKVARSMSD